VNIGAGKAYFSHGHKLNYTCACTVKFYVILKVKNTLVESEYYHTTYGT